MKSTTAISDSPLANKEILMLCDYSYYRFKQSTIDPKKFIKSDLRLICPRCNEELDFPGYGEITNCTQCNLKMHIHGSELICSA